MAKSNSEIRFKSTKDAELDDVIRKVLKTKPSSKKQERRTTAKTANVRTYDMQSPVRDPYLDGITKRWTGDKKPKRKLTPGERIYRAIKKRKAINHEKVLANEARIQEARAREPKPLPSLPEIMQPTLPKRKKGDKPNIVALIYAHRALQQFSSAHARRNLSGDEAYYQGLKARLKANLQELGLADMFDWSDF